MNFHLTDEQEFIQATVRKFIANECPRDVARELDAGRLFPGELLQELAGLGFCGLTVPEECGGAGRNLLGAIMVIEELATICPTLAGAFAGVALRGGQVISALGSEKQRQDLLPAVADGALLFSYALGNAADGATDDPYLTATRQGEAFYLNGAQSHVALADQADCLLTLAHTDEDAGPEHGSTLFIVDTSLPGIQLTEIEQVGFQGIRLYQVAFEGVELPADAVLGGADWLNRGWEQARQIRAVQHVETAAYGLGIARGAYEYALAYARERVQFGQPIAQFEAIQHMLVDVATEIRATRWLLYQACWLADQGRPFALEAAMAGVRATDLARRAALQGLHILGGYGYTMEYDAQRYVRDSLALLDGAETSELLKNQIGEMLGL
ncbi:MAG: acyl-CoA dehydrogenase family protein, partial [Anaerolineae bacterium]